jgi:hypothetical protein
MPVSTATVREHVLGRDLRTTGGFVAAAVALAALVVAAFFAPFPDWVPVYAASLVGAGAVGLALAGANAYLNRGVAATVLLAWSAVLPLWVPYAFTDAPIGREPTVESAVVTLLWGPAIPAVVVGVLAYAVGVGASALQHRVGE